jgi:hypothetical protein
MTVGLTEKSDGMLSAMENDVVLSLFLIDVFS